MSQSIGDHRTEATASVNKQIEEMRLNRKLAEWAGLKENHWTKEWFPGPNTSIGNLPDFTNSLDACFKWPVPKLRAEKWKVRISCGDLSGMFHVHLISWDKQYNRQNRPTISIYDKDNPALALCLAIEKLIDREVLPSE